ncbi:MAG: hypothetical protein JST00_07525 [Deltaproteobacteria bacterium]|nr:hypothetical protein [Deltaproteobacteria bacterium]
MRSKPLTRRDAMFTAGAVFGAAALQACSASLGPLTPDDARRRVATGDEREPIPSGAPPIVQALSFGLHAPSPHNTQAWRFRLLSDREAAFYVDRERLLPRTDPPARQIHIGCGCFAEAFALGASRLGHASRVELFPAGPYASDADIGHVPVARLSLSQAAPASPDPLADWIEARQTSRLVYGGEPVGEAEIARVIADAGLRHARASLVPARALAEHIALFDAAMTRETNTRATNEETRRWFRFDDDALATKRDGFGFAANGVTGIKGMFARWMVSDTEESWNSPGTIDKALSGFREAIASARGVVLLSTDANERTDQLETGRDVYRLLLSLTKHGYAAHPLTQVTQEYEEMKDLRERLDSLTGVRAPAKVQMILRIGKSEVPWRSYRRRLRDMIA